MCQELDDVTTPNHCTMLAPPILHVLNICHALSDSFPKSSTALFVGGFPTYVQLYQAFLFYSLSTFPQKTTMASVQYSVPKNLSYPLDLSTN